MSDDENPQFHTVDWRKEPIPERPTSGQVAVRTPALEPPESAKDTSHSGTLNGPDAPREADPSKPFPFLEPPRVAGDLGRMGVYRVLRVLGKGGMGIVFDCEDTGLGRRVAVKVLRPDIADDTLRKRFLREARLAALLTSEYLPHVYQVGEHHGLPFLAMEYLKGESLESRLQREGRLPVAEALAIARQVAEGLRVAHEQGLIHRDVKPANLWLEGDGPGSEVRKVKVLDFGLARPLDSDEGLTSHDQLMGTPRYMAPEQVHGDPLDARADLYALGSTLYHMLTGQAPFDGKNVTALLLAVVSEDAPSPRKLTTDVPESVATLVLELLSKSPNERPASATHVIERIRAIEEGRESDPATHPRRTQLERMAPAQHPTSARSTRGWAYALAAVLLVGIVGVAGWALWPGSTPQEPPANSQAAPATIPPSSEPLKIGILHSMTGTFAPSGRPLVDALTLAIEEINQAGGVLGRRLQPVLEDGCSDCAVFKQRAEKLITRDGVAVLFGCYGSSNRKRVAEVCERYDHLLFYYADYEGLEQSPCVAYVSGSPNQQLRPAAEWVVRNLDRRKFFLVGSDYVFSRAANAILKDELATMGHLKAVVVGEGYEPLESSDFAQIVREIQTAQPDMILNTIEGSSNVAFLQALRGSAGPRGRIPVLWFGFGEEEMAVLNPADLQGDYLAGHYFQTLEGKENEAFVARFRARFPTRRVTDGMLGAYASVYLWKQAVESARSVAPPDVRKALRGQSISTPEGKITLDPDTLHAWRTARVGKVMDQLRVQVEFTSPGPLKPEPFPPSRPRGEWKRFLADLYEGWGQRWEAPRKTK